jgi:hypothetical protein
VGIEAQALWMGKLPESKRKRNEALDNTSFGYPNRKLGHHVPLLLYTSTLSQLQTPIFEVTICITQSPVS